MNANRKHDPVTLDWEDILKLKHKYKAICNTIDYMDARAMGVVETDQGPMMSPMEYAFTLGQICELEGLLLYAGALTQREIFQSRKFKGELVNREPEEKEDKND